MLDKILNTFKKVLLFAAVAGVSCILLCLLVGFTGMIYKEGFIGTVAFLVAFVLPVFLGTAAVKKYSGKDSEGKAKKPIYKRWWFWVIVVVLLLGSCDTEPIELENTETTATTAPQETVSIDDAMNTVDNLVQLYFKNYTIKQENRTIRVSIWQDGVSDVILLARNGNMDCIIAWNDFIDSQKECSSNMYELVQALGESDISVELDVLDDRDKKSILLSTVNGVVVFDCLKD